MKQGVPVTRIEHCSREDDYRIAFDVCATSNQGLVLFLGYGDGVAISVMFVPHISSEMESNGEGGGKESRVTVHAFA